MRLFWITCKQLKLLRKASRLQVIKKFSALCSSAASIWHPNVVPVKSAVQIWQNVVAFSEYINFNLLIWTNLLTFSKWNFDKEKDYTCSFGFIISRHFFENKKTMKINKFLPCDKNYVQSSLGGEVLGIHRIQIIFYLTTFLGKFTNKKQWFLTMFQALLTICFCVKFTGLF